MYKFLNFLLKKSYWLTVGTLTMFFKIIPLWFFGDEIMSALKSRRRTVVHKNFEFYFSCPTRISDYRAKTFSTKEPQTLEWIDQMNHESVLWDIGANIGLYSIYAAKTRGIKVLSFEPSVFNLELLVKNIHLNNLTDLISIIPLPLYKISGFNSIILSSENIGGALNTFAELYGQDGTKLKIALKYNVLGLSIDDLVEKFHTHKPTHLKIDVDGIEHLIVAGATITLKTVQSVLIEVNEKFADQLDGINSTFISLGFRLHEKHSLGGDTLSHHSNQLWLREV